MDDQSQPDCYFSTISRSLLADNQQIEDKYFLDQENQSDRFFESFKKDCYFKQINDFEKIFKRILELQEIQDTSKLSVTIPNYINYSINDLATITQVLIENHRV